MIVPGQDKEITDRREGGKLKKALEKENRKIIIHAFVVERW